MPRSQKQRIVYFGPTRSQLRIPSPSFDGARNALCDAGGTLTGSKLGSVSSQATKAIHKHTQQRNLERLESRWLLPRKRRDEGGEQGVLACETPSRLPVNVHGQVRVGQKISRKAAKGTTDDLRSSEKSKWNHVPGPVTSVFPAAYRANRPQPSESPRSVSTECILTRNEEEVDDISRCFGMDHLSPSKEQFVQDSRPPRRLCDLSAEWEEVAANPSDSSAFFEGKRSYENEMKGKAAEVEHDKDGDNTEGEDDRINGESGKASKSVTFDSPPRVLLDKSNDNSIASRRKGHRMLHLGPARPVGMSSKWKSQRARSVSPLKTKPADERSEKDPKVDDGANEESERETRASIASPSNKLARQSSLTHRSKTFPAMDSAKRPNVEWLQRGNDVVNDSQPTMASIAPPPAHEFVLSRLSSLRDLLGHPEMFLSEHQGGLESNGRARRFDLLVVVMRVGALEETRDWKTKKQVPAGSKSGMMDLAEVVVKDRSGCALNIVLESQIATEWAGPESSEQTIMSEDLSEEECGDETTVPDELRYDFAAKGITTNGEDTTVVSLRRAKAMLPLRAGDVIVLSNLVLIRKRRTRGSNSKLARMGASTDMNSAVTVYGLANATNKASLELCWRNDIQKPSRDEARNFDGEALASFDPRCRAIWELAKNWEPN